MGLGSFQNWGDSLDLLLEISDVAPVGVFFGAGRGCVGRGLVLVGVLEHRLSGDGVQKISLELDGDKGSKFLGINLCLPLEGMVGTGYHLQSR